MNRHFFFAASAVLILSSISLAAHADGVSVVRGQFAQRVEAGKPVGDAASLGPDQMATYWVEVNSAKEPTKITLVWKVDGKEAVRQTLDVGRAPAWRTWGHFPIRKAHAIEVQVLDAEGNALRSDSMVVPGT